MSRKVLLTLLSVAIISLFTFISLMYADISIGIFKYENIIDLPDYVSIATLLILFALYFKLSGNLERQKYDKIDTFLYPFQIIVAYLSFGIILIDFGTYLSIFGYFIVFRAIQIALSMCGIRSAFLGNLYFSGRKRAQ